MAPKMFHIKAVPTSNFPKKTSPLKCQAKQSNSVASSSKKSMPANKFSQQPGQRREKALEWQGPAWPERGSHKAWFIRNHWKSYKAQAAFLGLSQIVHFGENNVFPVLAILFVDFSGSISVKLRDPAQVRGAKWSGPLVSGLLWTSILTNLIPSGSTHAIAAASIPQILASVIEKEMRCIV